MALLRERREQLMADWRREYKTSLLTVREDGWTLREFAACATNLPHDAAVHRASNSHQLDLSDQLLVALEHGIRVLAWQKTEDGQSQNPQHYPQPLIDIGGSGSGDEEQASPGALGSDRMSTTDLGKMLGWA